MPRGMRQRGGGGGGDRRLREKGHNQREVARNKRIYRRIIRTNGRRGPGGSRERVGGRVQERMRRSPEGGSHRIFLC